MTTTWSAGCRKRRKFWAAIEVAAAACFLWSLWGVAGELPKLARGLPFAWDYAMGMFPPDFKILPELWGPWVETVRMAVLGIALSSAVAAPLSFLAARDTAPNTGLYVVTRTTIGFLRAMPTLLWAILFVATVGLGPLAGTFALTCHCVGTLGKYFSEAIEAVAPKIGEVLEAMRIDGASERQAVWHGLVPEVLPLFAGYVLYYFEWCVRVGTIMGLVGAGGIGLRLTMAIRLFRRREAAAIVLVILATVAVVDLFSRVVRARLLEA